MLIRQICEPLKAYLYRLTATRLFNLPGLRSPHASKAVGIVMVHGVHTPAMFSRAAAPSSSTPFRAFEANVRSIARNFRFISLDQAVMMVKGQATWQERSIVLTFDDSLKCLAEVVAPRLSHWGIPATFFISTEAIETKQPYWWMRLEFAVSQAKKRDIAVELSEFMRFNLTTGQCTHELQRIKAFLRAAPSAKCDQVVALVESQAGVSLAASPNAYPHAEIMTWENVRGILKLGMDIGCHTVAHTNLTLLPDCQLQVELEASRRIIEQQSGRSCRHLCYPYGAYSDKVRKYARVAGYASAVTTDSPGWNSRGSDPYRLARFAMPAESYRLSYTVSGIAEVAQKCKRFLKSP